MMNGLIIFHFKSLLMFQHSVIDIVVLNTFPIVSGIFFNNIRT